MSTIQDTDLLLVNRGGTDYKVTVADLKDYFNPKMPWEGHDGGIWHITNVTGGDLKLEGRRFTAWNIDGTNERKITSVAPGEELVFVSGSNSNGLFRANQAPNWEFGELTDTSKVTSMREMFLEGQNFNADISNWDTSNVTDMTQMFWNCKVFNSDVSNWDTSKVTNMGAMFETCWAFNSDISNWDVSNVTNMRSMLSGAGAFNSDVSGWDTSNVTTMDRMFNGANSFNQDIGGWDVSNVTNMESMFNDAEAFNQDIGSWNVSNVTNMRGMFYGARVFNQDLSGWCVSKISSKPTNFEYVTGFEGQTEKQPQWGTCPRGEDKA